MKQYSLSAIFTISSAIFFGIFQESNAAVTLLSREASSSNQIIPSSALDFSVNSSSVLVEKAGGPLNWSFSNGALFNGAFARSASWTVGNPIAAGTTNTATYLPLGPSYGAQRVTSGSFSFVTTQNLPTIDLTLLTIPNGNTSPITYSYSVLVNNVAQFSQTGVTDSNSPLDLEIFKFQISGLTAGDTVSFRVQNASGSNGFHNFAFLGGYVNASVPEPSTFLLGGLSSLFLLRRRRR